VTHLRRSKNKQLKKNKAPKKLNPGAVKGQTWVIESFSRKKIKEK